MSRYIEIGDFKVFPGTQIVCHFQDGSEFYPSWGLVASINGGYKKLWCGKHTFGFYRNFKPCVIFTSAGFYGAISDGTTVLIYAPVDYKPVLFKDETEFYNLYSESKKR